MQRRFLFASVAVVALTASSLIGAQTERPGDRATRATARPQASSWAPSRTPDGQPDLQGTWVNFDDTPFESSGPGRKPSDVNPPEHWADHDSPTSRARTAMVVEPRDGLVPLLPAAEAKRDDNFAHIGDSYVYETPWVRCITRGVPGGFFPAQYNNAYQIVQAPGYVVIRSEMVHDTRIIPIDGRPQLGAAIRQWNGDSRGHWEGNTLVVETRNYNDKGMIATSAASGRLRGVGQSDALHVVERFTRTGEKTIEYEASIEDPKTYAKPWKVAFPFNLDNSYEIFEYSCHEGNYAMVNELTAGRLRDRQATDPK